MANFPKMKLTNAGLNLLTNVQAGADDLTFTKTVLGDGELTTPLASLTALVSPKVEIAITEGKTVGTSTYQIGAFFSNEEVATGFWWREIGVFAKGNDGNEILYCYANAGDAGDFIPVGSDERVEKYIYQSLSIGNATNVTAEINASDTFIPTRDKGAAGGVAPLDETGKVAAEYLPEMDYAGTARVEKIESDLSGHLSASNPHGITAEKVGLGKVPNVATNDQTPTYTEASTLTALTSGEKLSVAFGKIKKAITDLISHLADTTKHITATERTTWNGKAPTFHSSAGTEYGIGNATTYGHLALTDAVESIASVDSGLAATPKAVKTVYDLANRKGYKLLKTITSAVNLSAAKGNGTYMHVPFTGIDLEAYEELRVFVDGNISMSKAEQAASYSNGFYLCVSNGTKQGMDISYPLYKFDQYYGAPAISFSIDEVFVTLYPLLNYRAGTQYETSTIITTKNKNWFYMRNIGTNNPYVTNVGEAIYISAFLQNNANNSALTATGSLTISIYGKEMIKP